ncbi:MAG: hypothetical protein ACYDA7_02915 [Acidithiobacillus sp.]
MRRLHAPDQGAQHRLVEDIPHHAVLNAAIDIRIVVDLHDENAFGRFLEIHTIESVPNQVGGADGSLQNERGCFVEGDRAKPALQGAPVVQVTH